MGEDGQDAVGLQVFDRFDRRKDGEEQKPVDEGALQRLRRERNLRRIVVERKLRPEQRRPCGVALIFRAENPAQVFCFLVGGGEEDHGGQHAEAERRRDRSKHEPDADGADGREEIERVARDRVGTGRHQRSVLARADIKAAPHPAGDADQNEADAAHLDEFVRRADENGLRQQNRRGKQDASRLQQVNARSLTRFHREPTEDKHGVRLGLVRIYGDARTKRRSWCIWPRVFSPDQSDGLMGVSLADFDKEQT